MNRKIIIIAIALAGASVFAQGNMRQGGRMRENPDAKLHRFSTTVEKERPQLNDETKRLIAAYQRNPTAENKAALRNQCAINYDNIVKRKKAKLEELKRTAKHQSKVDEMQEIVDEMLANREYRIDQTLARFTDPRFRERRRSAADGAFLPHRVEECRAGSRQGLPQRHDAPCPGIEMKSPAGTGVRVRSAARARGKP